MDATESGKSACDGAAGKQVAWEVKAVRNDRWVQEYGFTTEQKKDASKTNTSTPSSTDSQRRGASIISPL